MNNHRTHFRRSLSRVGIGSATGAAEKSGQEHDKRTARSFLELVHCRSVMGAPFPIIRIQKFGRWRHRTHLSFARIFECKSYQPIFKRVCVCTRMYSWAQSVDTSAGTGAFAEFPNTEPADAGRGGKSRGFRFRLQAFFLRRRHLRHPRGHAEFCCEGHPQGLIFYKRSCSRALRVFPLYESLALQVRAEIFNVLNHPNFGPPSSILTFTPVFRFPQFGQSANMFRAISVGRQPRRRWARSSVPVWRAALDPTGNQACFL